MLAAGTRRQWAGIVAPTRPVPPAEKGLRSKAVSPRGSLQGNAALAIGSTKRLRTKPRKRRRASGKARYSRPFWNLGTPSWRGLSRFSVQQTVLLSALLACKQSVARCCRGQQLCPSGNPLAAQQVYGLLFCCRAVVAVAATASLSAESAGFEWRQPSAVGLSSGAQQSRPQCCRQSSKAAGKPAYSTATASSSSRGGASSLQRPVANLLAPPQPDRWLG